MSIQPIKWGILGTSFISEVMAKAIQASTTGELTAIASRSHEKAKQFGAMFSIPTFYAEYEQLLQNDEIDVVYIGLPNHLHKEWILRAIAAGKHVLCEKPFVLNVAEAQEVIAAVRGSNLFCMEALMYRCHPLTKKLQELVTSKVIGDIKLFQAAYTANIAQIANPTAGGSIRNLGCYPLSLVRLLANAEPIEMRALGRMNLNTNTDNQASLLLQFASGAIATISTADDIEMFWQFEIYGTEGNLKVITNPWLPDETNNKIIVQPNNKAPFEINVTAEQPLYSYQIDRVGQCIRNGNFIQHDGISLQDSLGNITILEQWLHLVQSNANFNGHPVLVPVYDESNR